MPRYMFFLLSFFILSYIHPTCTTVKTEANAVLNEFYGEYQYINVPWYYHGFDDNTVVFLEETWSKCYMNIQCLGFSTMVYQSTMVMSSDSIKYNRFLGQRNIFWCSNICHTMVFFEVQ